MCFELHKQVAKSGISTCKSYYRCKTCNQTINQKMHKKSHMCGEVYCKTCKDYFDHDHACYMLPVYTEENQNKSDPENDNKKDDRSVYIFFDIECTQDDLIECEFGYQRGEDSLKCINCKKSSCGTYEHKPNLCVAHKVCLECCDKELTPSSICEHCGQNERVFSGSSTLDEFCKWLFSGSNNGATVLCQNFKGYDSFPILQYLLKTKRKLFSNITVAFGMVVSNVSLATP